MQPSSTISTNFWNHKPHWHLLAAMKTIPAVSSVDKACKQLTLHEMKEIRTQMCEDCSGIGHGTKICPTRIKLQHRCKGKTICI